MKKNILISLFIAGTFITAVPSAHAAGPGSFWEKGFHNKRGARMQELYKDLNLTPEQQKQLQENKKKQREQMQALFSGIREKRAQLRQELQKDNLGMDTVNQLNAELKALQAQILDHRLEGILEVRKILTPDQFKQFMSKMNERKERFQNRRGGKKDNSIRDHGL